MIFVVAEIGVNWDGDFALATSMMQNAKKAGCDAVKFQAFNERIVGNHQQKSRLLKSSISRTNVEKINSIAKSVGIEWFCTPMYPEVVDILEPFVERFKIREADSKPIIEKQPSELFDKISKTGKEVIISCQKSPHETMYFEHHKIKWLYCVPKYPCELADLDFSRMKDFHGFSYHCTQIIVPITAAILGATIIEVHITSDKSKDFIDNNVSFGYSELREMIKLIRLSEKIKK